MPELVMCTVKSFDERGGRFCTDAEPLVVAVQGTTVRLEVGGLVIEAPWLELWQALASGRRRVA